MNKKVKAVLAEAERMLDREMNEEKEEVMNNGQTKPGYNEQISTENLFITHYSMSCRLNDWGTFINHLDTVKLRYGVQARRWWRTPAMAARRTTSIWI